MTEFLNRTRVSNEAVKTITMTITKQVNMNVSQPER